MLLGFVFCGESHFLLLTDTICYNVHIIKKEGYESIMSVIMAYETKDKLYLGSDNRLSQQDGTFINDDRRKIFIMNKGLAIGFSGNAATQCFFESYFENSSAFKKLKYRKYRIEDILFHIDTMFMSFKINIDKEYAKNILDSSSYFIIVGKNKNNENSIVSVSYVNGNLDYAPTKMILFPPLGLDMQSCSKIFVKNYHEYTDICIQKSVKEISQKCKTVSPSGDIWTYDIRTGKSTLEHFE